MGDFLHFISCQKNHPFNLTEKEKKTMRVEKRLICVILAIHNKKGPFKLFSYVYLCYVAKVLNAGEMMYKRPVQ